MAHTLYQGVTTPAASVTVYWAGTTTKPTIYDGLAGSAKSNPITADALGKYAFWIDDGHYKITNGTVSAGVAADLTDVRIEYPESVIRAKDITLLPFLGNPAGTVESWYEGAVNGGITTAGPIVTTNTTQSTSSTTGALIVTGGAGIGGDMFTDGSLEVGGDISNLSVNNSTSPTTGAIKTPGGIGVAKAAWVGGLMNIAGQVSAAAVTDSTSTTTGALVTAGGAGIAKAIFGGTTLDMAGAATFHTTAELKSVNAAQYIIGQASELITLSIAGTTTDSTADLLPANSIIDAVTATVITTITTATDWKLGDPTSAGRFSAVNATMTAGASSVGLLHMAGDVATVALGPTQAAAAKVRITTTGTPGAGAIRVTVFYRQFVAPTS